MTNEMITALLTKLVLKMESENSRVLAMLENSGRSNDLVASGVLRSSDKTVNQLVSPPDNESNTKSKQARDITTDDPIWLYSDAERLMDEFSARHPDMNCCCCVNYSDEEPKYAIRDAGHPGNPRLTEWFSTVTEAWEAAEDTFPKTEVESELEEMKRWQGGFDNNHPDLDWRCHKRTVGLLRQYAIRDHGKGGWPEVTDWQSSIEAAWAQAKQRIENDCDETYANGNVVVCDVPVDDIDSPYDPNEKYECVTDRNGNYWIQKGHVNPVAVTCKKDLSALAWKTFRDMWNGSVGNLDYFPFEKTAEEGLPRAFAADCGDRWWILNTTEDGGFFQIVAEGRTRADAWLNAIRIQPEVKTDKNDSGEIVGELARCHMCGVPWGAVHQKECSHFSMSDSRMASDWIENAKPNPVEVVRLQYPDARCVRISSYGSSQYMIVIGTDTEISDLKRSPREAWRSAANGIKNSVENQESKRLNGYIETVRKEYPKAIHAKIGRKYMIFDDPSSNDCIVISDECDSIIQAWESAVVQILQKRQEDEEAQVAQWKEANDRETEESYVSIRNKVIRVYPNAICNYIEDAEKYGIFLFDDSERCVSELCHTDKESWKSALERIKCEESVLKLFPNATCNFELIGSSTIYEIMDGDKALSNTFTNPADAWKSALEMIRSGTRPSHRERKPKVSESAFHAVSREDRIKQAKANAKFLGTNIGDCDVISAFSNLGLMKVIRVGELRSKECETEDEAWLDIADQLEAAVKEKQQNKAKTATN